MLRRKRFTYSATQGVIVTGAYVGPGDVAPALAWWGLRAYSASSVGNNLFNVKRSSDGTTTNIVSTTGGFDTSNAFFDGSLTYLVEKLFDQTGNGHDLTLVSGVSSSQPSLVLSAFLGFPALRVSASTFNTYTSASFVVAQPFTYIGVVRDTTAVSVNGNYLFGNVNDVSPVLSFNADNGAGSNQLGMWAGNNSFATSLTLSSTAGVLIGKYNGASSVVYWNGVSTVTLSPGTNGVSSIGLLEWVGQSSSDNFDFLGDAAVYSTAAPAVSSLTANSRNFFGF